MYWTLIEKAAGKRPLKGIYQMELQQLTLEFWNQRFSYGSHKYIYTAALKD